MRSPPLVLSLASLVIHGCLANLSESGKELSDKEPNNLISGSVVDSTVKFGCSNTESQIVALKAAVVVLDVDTYGRGDLANDSMSFVASNMLAATIETFSSTVFSISLAS